MFLCFDHVKCPLVVGLSLKALVGLWQRCERVSNPNLKSFAAPVREHRSHSLSYDLSGLYSCEWNWNDLVLA